jgi:hypothetical protein
MDRNPKPENRDNYGTYAEEEFCSKIRLPHLFLPTSLSLFYDNGIYAEEGS